MDFKVFGEEKRYIQIGTVMTLPEYRKQGLSRILMEKAIADYRDKCDLLYLFANNSVLEFYPKFGFEKIKQYQCVKDANLAKKENSIKKLDMSDERNKDFAIKKVTEHVSVSKVSMCGNAELIMFYLTMFMQNDVYYLENYDAVVIAKFKKDMIKVHDIFCNMNVHLDDILNSLVNSETKKLILFFTPEDTSCYEIIPLEGEGTLFAMGKDVRLLKSSQFMFPKLSYA
jgi:predicted GNAT family acetyltransferase